VTRALELPGIRGVITGKDVAGIRIGRRIYDIPILAEDCVRFWKRKIVYTNTVPCSHMRRPSDPQGFFANESQLDIVASKLGIDRIDLRRKNLMRDGDTGTLATTKFLDQRHSQSRHTGVRTTERAGPLQQYEYR
jgi:xanthine dehydrogenase molybdopterin-binding subunit B